MTRPEYAPHAMTIERTQGGAVGEHNSPYFAAGCTDGERDTELVSQCPPGSALGPDPERDWSYMYQRGYARTYHPTPCPCDGSCKRGKQYGEAPDGS